LTDTDVSRKQRDAYVAIGRNRRLFGPTGNAEQQMIVITHEAARRIFAAVTIRAGVVLNQLYPRLAGRERKQFMDKGDES